MLFVFQTTFSQELLMDFELVTAPDVSAPKFDGGGIEKFYEFINQEFDFIKAKKVGIMKISFSFTNSEKLKTFGLPSFRM